MEIYIGKNNSKILSKVTKRDLKEDLQLLIGLNKVYKGDLYINFYHIVKGKNKEGNDIKRLDFIYGKRVLVDGYNYIHYIPNEIKESLKGGEEYLYVISTEEGEDIYRFSIEKEMNIFAFIIPFLLGLIILLSVLLLMPEQENNNSPIVETIRDISGEVNQGSIEQKELDEKEVLLNHIQSYSRFVVSSAISIGQNNQCDFVISNPEKTTFQCDLSLSEMNKILEGELTISETGKENIYEFDSVNIIQVSLQNENGEEFYCSPALNPNSYVENIKLTKDIPEGTDSIIAVLKTFNPKGEYLNSFQFTIQVNRLNA